MSKIWAAVSVQSQAFLMKNDFLDSECYGYVFLVKKHVKPYIFSFSGSWAPFYQAEKIRDLINSRDLGLPLTRI